MDRIVWSVFVVLLLFITTVITMLRKPGAESGLCKSKSETNKQPEHVREAASATEPKQGPKCESKVSPSF